MPVQVRPSVPNSNIVDFRWLDILFLRIYNLRAFKSAKVRKSPSVKGLFVI